MPENTENSILTIPENSGLIGSMESMNAGERDLCESVYDLFTQFRDKSRDYLTEISLSREMRELKDSQLTQYDPQLNTLNSTIDNMVADYMDNLPEAVMLPENPEKAAIADQMTDVLGWTLHHAHFKPVWRRVVEDATTTGTGVIQAFYDDSMYVAGRKGGINLLSWRPEAWLPDPLYENFQDGRAVFKVCTHPLSYFEQHYPDKAKYVAADATETLDYLQLAESADQFTYDDPLVCLLECWYRRYDAKKKRYTVHMAVVAGKVLLYDSRTDNPDGVYKHGMYPFVTLRFRERKGSAYGTGMCYEFADTQRMINRYTRYIDENARASSRPKLLVSKDAHVNVTDMSDYEKQIIEVEGRVDKETVDWFQANPLNSLIPTMIAKFQDMMKQDSGQNQFSRGEGGLGVTAASAISMLQEAGGKIVRLHTSAYMDSFQELCEQLVSLVAEFYDEPMIVMIHNAEGGMPTKQVEFDGSALNDPSDPYMRPAMYVRVEVQKSNPNQIQAKNQLLMQIAQIAQATSPIPPSMLVRAMSMSGKEEIVQLLDATNAQQQQLMQLQQMAQQLAGENDQLKQMLDAAVQDAQSKTQLLSAVSGQMRSAANQPSSMPSQPQQTNPNADYTTLAPGA